METPPISTTPEPTLQPETPLASPFTPPQKIKLPLVLGGILVLFLVGGVGFLLGQKLSQPKAPPQVQIAPTPPIPTPTPDLYTEQSRSATANWKTYRNENIGFELKYPQNYSITGERDGSISFGFGVTPEAKPETYLTISTTNLTNYKSLKSCSEVNMINPDSLPCLNEGKHWGQKDDILETELGGVSAKSLYVTEAVPDVHYHIVQTTTKPFIELKMFVAGGGLDLEFKQILSTFRFD